VRPGFLAGAFFLLRRLALVAKGVQPAFLISLHLCASTSAISALSLSLSLLSVRLCGKPSTPDGQLF